MARRKPKGRVPETSPVLDSKSDADDYVVQLMLLPHHLNNAIRFVKVASLDRVQQLSTATQTTLERLGRKRDPSKAVVKLPEGSDQIDVQSLIVWMNKLTRRNRKAINQLIKLDATCASRGA